MSRIVKISSTSSLQARKRSSGASRQHSQHSIQDGAEPSSEAENFPQRSIRKSYQVRRKGVSRYYPTKVVRRSVDAGDVFCWLKQPVRPSFFNRTESELFIHPVPRLPQKVKLNTQLSELESIAIITVFEHIEGMIGVLDPGDHSALQDLNILYYSTPTERFYMKPLDLPLLAGQDILVQDADHRECMKVMKILHEAINELLWFGSYAIFRTAVLIPHIVKEDEKQLMDEIQKNLEKIGDIKKEISGYARERKRKKSQITTEQEKVQGYLKKQKFFQSRDMRYLDLWNKSREEQHTYSLSRIEKHLKKRCEDIQEKIKLTVYADNNAMLFLRMDIKDLQNKIRYYERRRTVDGEALENSVSEMRVDFDDLHYTTLKARLLLGTMREKYEKVKARKQQIIQEERLLRVQEAAVIKLQRWWRRQLLLKSLKKEKKAKKGKKGKKKKK